MPTHSLCIDFPLASVPSIVTFVLNGKAISYLTVLFRPIPRPICDFLAFNFQVPSKALPKQTAPAASHTKRDTKVVLDFMVADQAGVYPAGQCFGFFNRGLHGCLGSGSDVSSSQTFRDFRRSTLNSQPTGHWSRVTRHFS